jgi:Tfp pilus assembly protein FimT
VILRKTIKITEKGFTFLEIAAILVIIGIISAVAISRIGSTAAYGISAELDQVKSHLRYAQSRAIRTDATWGINFSNGSTYWLFQTAAANRIIFVGEGSNQVNLSKLSITSAPQTITFDRFGSSGAANITVTTSGGGITIASNTGFFP